MTENTDWRKTLREHLDKVKAEQPHTWGDGSASIYDTMNDDDIDRLTRELGIKPA
jgi:hypothetical protein